MVEQWQRIVRRDEDESAAGLYGVEGAKYRGVADRVWDGTGVEDGIVGRGFVVAVAGVLFGLGVKDTVHGFEQCRDRNGRIRGEKRQDPLVFLGNVAFECGKQCPSGRRNADRMSLGAQLIDEGFQLGVLGEHRIDQLRCNRVGRWIQHVLFGLGMRQQFDSAPPSQGITRRLWIASLRSGEKNGLDQRADVVEHVTMMADDAFCGSGFFGTRGDGELHGISRFSLVISSKVYYGGYRVK